MRASGCQALCAVEQWKMICSQSAENTVVMTVKHAILVAILTIKTIYYIRNQSLEMDECTSCSS